MTRPQKQPHERRAYAVKDARTGRTKISSVASLRANVTLAEKAFAEEQAHKAGISIAEYVRRRALHEPVAAVAPKAGPSPALISELNRIGVNLNQLTRHANAGKLQAASVELALDELRAALAKVLGDGP